MTDMMQPRCFARFRRAFAHSSAGLAALAFLSLFGAQDAPPNGMREIDLRTHALTGATVVIRPGEEIENATIIIRDGVIEAVGPDLAIPAGARVWDVAGKTVYAGLIEAALLVNPGEIAQGPGSHWNRHVHPELSAAERELPSAADAKALRDLGFTSAAVFPSDGIFRGSGVVLSLAGDNGEGETFKPIVYVEKGAMALGFDRGGGYPSSLMGSIAAVRQTLLDAQWHLDATDIWNQYPAGNEPPKRADALEALEPVITRAQPVLFEVTDEHNFLRAAKVMEEFNLSGTILGSGLEFRRVDDVAATGLPAILPLNYPERPDVSSLDLAESTSLETMLNWEQAPTNPRRLINAGMTIALSAHGLRNKGNFYSNLRRAINNGLTQDQALAALTITPAQLLGVDDVLGTIEPGKIANLLVVDTSLFDKELKIRDVWIDGRRYVITPEEDPSYEGRGTIIIATALSADPIERTITIDTKKKTVSIDLGEDQQAKARDVSFDGRRLSFLVDGRVLNTAGYVQFVGTLTGGSFSGTGALPDRSRFTFSIELLAEPEVVVVEEGDAAGALAEVATAEATEPQAGAAEPETPEEETEQATEEVPSPEEDPDDDGISGNWAGVLQNDRMPGGELPFTASLTLAEDGRLSGSFDSEFFSADITTGSFNKDSGAVSFTIEGGGMTSNFEGTITEGQMTGQVISAQFNSELQATREGDGQRAGRGDEKKKPADEEHVAPEKLVHPLGAYGVSAPPRPQDVLITNATIWTSGPRGIIENGMLLVRDGKIAFVGANDDPGAPAIIDSFETGLIDARGKHVTPGIIDCHSHTGISGGVNEGSQAVTAEVRIADCVDPDDINWYRQLAGGLIGASQLHGSANPIGGQNSVVKLKWGGSAADFPIDGAIPGIKFALGENVKRSENRYPNTRMGVETLIRDSFIAAQRYMKEWDDYDALTPSEKERTIPPQKDLELDTLAEILRGERLVHCHSYRQDEILMLLRLAEEFGFTIGTLQHILEGYKVADDIARHGAGASTFSDWWAYKVEVMDAIPYNGAIMHDVGVVVSFNSDSDELARRLNTEAAKAVRYGGLTPEEALKFVTINPAIQLHVDDRTGSLEVGKDADFVIWSGDPLSTYTRCEQTWIEGARYFSLEDDLKLREAVTAERQRLIQTILSYAHGEPEQSKPAEAPVEPATPSRAQTGGFVADIPF
jgi:imidazolonepropionase-like amidohydrolase